MSILITGGTGFLGAPLARTLVERGEDVVLMATKPRLEHLADLKDKIRFVRGDIRIWNEVLNIVKDNHVDGIFHMAAMLSTPSEKNPWDSFHVNVVGTMNMLEAARLFGVKRVFLAGTSATYGMGISHTVTEETIQRPTSYYGIGKLYDELMGRFYSRKFGIDFRCIRYFAVIGPGAKNMTITQYNSWMIENAALGKPYDCFVAEDIAIPLTYFKDAVDGAVKLYYAPKENIKSLCYNIVSTSPARPAKELELAVKRHIPDARISYRPDPATMDMLRGYPVREVDDSVARAEWGWQPRYTDYDSIVSDFIRELREHPGWYGVG